MIKSKALEVNLASYRVDVSIDEKYFILQDIMSRYYGLMEGFNTFLKELSHPYRNWNFIVSEARRYSLEYFHLMDSHPAGPDGVRLFVDIFMTAIEESREDVVKSEAVDNLLLFLQKVIKESHSGIERFLPVLNEACDGIRQLDQNTFFLVVKSFYQLKRVGEMLRHHAETESGSFEAVNALLMRYFRATFVYWLGLGDPREWFEEEAREVDALGGPHYTASIFADISHDRLEGLNHRLDEIDNDSQAGSAGRLHELLLLDGYSQIVETYRQMPQKLLEAGGKKYGNQWKVTFLFHMMAISGLTMIHEEVLRDINRTVSWLIANETDLHIRGLIQKTFSILQKQAVSYPAAALNCVLNMGKGVYRTDDSELVNYFFQHVIELPFQTPGISGVGEDWQIRVNSAHILNIRTWLELIELNPKWSTRLISVLIIHLALSGVFIKDTDLFPRDITRFLNRDIGPVYNLAKQLTRLFPAYFNDIGAEGKLRDISTRIDEIARRRDVLIHFLRKQSHVESSNQIIAFMEATIHFWATRDKQMLQQVVPPEVFEQIATNGPYVDGVHEVMTALKRKGIDRQEVLLTLPEDELKKMLTEVHGEVTEDDRERVGLLIAFYKLLHQKYSVDYIELKSYISQLSIEAFPDLNRLRNALSENEAKKKLFMLLEYLGHLKSIILSPEKFEIREDIYKKRHITIDIPSMYGSYHELKFDALGLSYRIESLVNVLFEELIDSIDLSLITKATFYQIYARIRLFDKALRLDGISSVEIERQLDLLAHSLEVKGFTYTQYLDIFKGFAAAVKNIINDYFQNIHEENLNSIIDRLHGDQILCKYRLKENQGGIDPEKNKLRVSEIFFRDRIALSLGLQQLDRFLSRILNTLFQQADKLRRDELYQLLLYDPDNAMTSIFEPDNRVTGLIYLGNKGFNLVVLHSLSLPVPPGFIITTEVFRCRKVIESYRPAEQNLKDQIARHIVKLEEVTGKAFGNPRNPLLFSVRSGSSISQPGMMDTFLNVGINEEIAGGLSQATGNAWFAWDNYRRFLQCYGMASGLERDDFDGVISELKNRAGIAYKKDFTGEQMKSVALAYKSMIRDNRIEIPEDPFDQLTMTIQSVFDSWESDKARTYRRIMGISDDWGTAVTVQSMVYGNLTQNSGSGVFFTHNPRWPGETLKLWGDFTLGNQGEDVVAGLVITLPISIYQQEEEMRPTDITLETHFPEIYTALKNWAGHLIYDKGWPPQEMEFTFESPAAQNLYLLQGRDMSMRERKQVRTFDLIGITEECYLGHGIGIGGGALTGRVVFSLEEIYEWRQTESETKLILARSDTVPDDIREIYAADGLLTARGGVTSHASVVAHRLGKTCVVCVGDLICNEKQRSFTLKDTCVKSGDFISIDGREGSVYLGKLKINAEPGVQTV
ncbi:MAG: PEP/pyruvate-binding domain-containing protein [Desulfobacterales bacterium]